jgi:hypothetical protein
MSFVVYVFISTARLHQHAASCRALYETIGTKEHTQRSALVNPTPNTRCCWCFVLLPRLSVLMLPIFYASYSPVPLRLAFEMAFEL